MKKFTQAVSVTLVCAMLAMTFAGCGKEENDVTPATEPEQAVEQATETQTDEVKEEEKEVEEAPAEEPEEEIVMEPVDIRTPVQKFWGGDWFGVMWVTKATGNYKNFDNSYWDAMGKIDVDADGNADMLLWYEGQTRDNPVSETKLTISADSGSGEMGAAISESGWMFVNSDTGNGDIKHADWIIDPMTDQYSAKYGNNLMHIEGEYIDGSGTIYYHFFMRKWGELWDDIASAKEILVPEYYDKWYLPLINEGYAMPDNLGDEGSVTMAENESKFLAYPEGAGDKEDTDAGSADAPASSGGTYDGSELVLCDDEYCKIVVNGMGCNPYNDSWIGYLVQLTNKTDFSVNFSSYAEPAQQEQTIDSLGTRSTCYFKGEKCKTHFDYTVNSGFTVDDCIVIDGVTDVSQLGDVKGYICVVNNDTGEILNNVPYSF